MAKINQDLFENMPIGKAATKLMIPTVIGSLVAVLYSLADTFFVAMLNDKVQTAAVAIAAPVLLAFNAVNNLFGIGSSSLMSRALGQGDIDTFKKSGALGFYGSVISGAILSILCLSFLKPLVTLLGADSTTADATIQYMKYAVICGAVPTILNVVMGHLVRSEGNALHASIGTMSGCILNIILDPIFILPKGFNMGAASAGLATFLSNCVACIYFFVLIFVRRKKTNITFNPKYIPREKKIILSVFAVGIPASIQNLLNVTGMTILDNFVSANGAAAMAAIGIAQKIQQIPLQIAFGASQGIMPLIGYSYSSKNKKRFKDTVLFCAKLMIPIMFSVAVICFVFAPQLISIFMKEESVIYFGKFFLRGLVTALPFMILDFTAVGVFQSVGQGQKSLLFAILRKIIFEIPAIFLLNRFIGVTAITFSQAVSEIILAFFGIYMVKRIINKRDYWGK